MTVLCPPSMKSYQIGVDYDIPHIEFLWFQKNINLHLHNKLTYKGNSKYSDKNFALIDSDDEDDDQN